MFELKESHGKIDKWKKQWVNHTQLRCSRMECFVLPHPSAPEGNTPSLTTPPPHPGRSWRLGPEQGTQPSPLRARGLGPSLVTISYQQSPWPSTCPQQQALCQRQVRRPFQLRATVQGASFEDPHTRVQVKPGLTGPFSNREPSSPVRAQVPSFVK